VQQQQQSSGLRVSLTDRLQPACRRSREARVGQLLTAGHSAMLCDLAATDAVLVSAECPLGRAADDLLGLDEFVQQCRHDAGTLTYRLPSCRIRSDASPVIKIIIMKALGKRRLPKFNGVFLV